MKINYANLREELLRYAQPEEGSTLDSNVLIDGVLEFLVVTNLLDPHAISEWPDNGLVAPLLDEHIAELAHG